MSDEPGKFHIQFSLIDTISRLTMSILPISRVFKIVQLFFIATTILFFLFLAWSRPLFGLLTLQERYYYPQSLQQALIQVRQQSTHRRSAISDFYASLLDGNANDLHNRWVPLSLLHKLPPLHEPCAPNTLERIGTDGDGGKWVCGDYFPKNLTDCVIFSLGSFGEFSFEQAISEYTKNQCMVHTFDCTGSWTSPYTNFHPWCLGPVDTTTKDGRIYKKWSTIMQDLGVSRVDYLKMDIEGFEWGVFPEILNQPKELLPKQIAFEIHFFPPTMMQQPTDIAPELNFIGTRYFLKPLLELFRLFDRDQYMVSTMEYNPLSIEECCSEFVLVLADS